MEQPTTNTSLFDLSIDNVTKSHLSETARWARFLAIVGFVFLALFLIIALFGSTFLFSAMTSVEGSAYGSGYATGIFIGYFIIIAVIYFFPLFFTLRFANKMKVALAGNDQEALNNSFQNLKACFRYLGILTIIGLALMAIGLIVGILGAAAFS